LALDGGWSSLLFGRFVPGKALFVTTILVQAWTGPEGSRRLRLVDLQKFGT
jgi:hypothetical protein